LLLLEDQSGGGHNDGNGDPCGLRFGRALRANTDRVVD
jgi:hypothetical protein